MGLIGKLLGVADATRAFGEVATGVAEVFTPNATRRMERSFDAYKAALDAQSAEFANARTGWFNRLVNGLNRLPRPALALGTLGLFTYAMIDPIRFAARMQGLGFVPEPLWWLLGAIVSFYFGAREMHYFRNPDARRLSPPPAQPPAPPPNTAPQEARSAPNMALEEWRRAQDG